MERIGETGRERSDKDGRGRDRSGQGMGRKVEKENGRRREDKIPNSNSHSLPAYLPTNLST